METNKPMKIGDFVKVYDSGIKALTPGVILNIKTFEDNNFPSYLISTDSDTFWTGEAEMTQEKPDLSEILEPNCCVLKEQELPSWSISKSPTLPGEWEFIGWTQFFDHLQK